MTIDADDIPVNEVVKTDSQLVVRECVICGETHYHGLDDLVAIGGRSHRVAHCATRQRGGYFIEYAAEAERPEPWLTHCREHRAHRHLDAIASNGGEDDD